MGKMTSVIVIFSKLPSATFQTDKLPSITEFLQIETLCCHTGTIYLSDT